MSLLTKFRTILYIFRIFYWLAFKAVVKGYLNGSIHLAQQFWSKQLIKLFRTKLYKCKGSQPRREEKCMILANHRSQADFWVHNVLTQYSCNFLARMAVGVVFFVFGIFANKTVWFFNRGANINPNKFNEWLNYKFTTAPRKSLLAYPEGHRMAGTVIVDKAKFKTGMLRYAYREKIPVQMLMSFGNENIFNEKKLHLGWDQKVYYSFSKVYYPNDFAQQKDFVLHMKDQFCDFFDEIWKVYTEGGEVEEVRPDRRLHHD